MKGRRGYIVIIAVIAVMFVYLITLNVFFQRTLQMEMAEQFNRQQLVLANTEASHIHDYLGNVKNEMMHMARSVSAYQARSEADFKALSNVLFKEGDGVKKRVEVLDRRGSSLFTRGNVHAEGPDGKKIIARSGGLCPGDVLMQQNTQVLSIIAPVCRYDTLLGAAVISLNIQDIAKSFLNPLRTSSAGNAWMMDEKGNLLYHPTQPDMVGRNLYKTDSSCFKCHQTFDMEKKIIEGRGDFCSGEYYGRYVAPTGEDKILAYSTALGGDTRWIVAVSAPYSEVTMPIRRSMRLYSWIVLFIFVATIAVSAMMIVSYRKREQAEAHARHEEELEMMHAEKFAALERLTSGITDEIGNPLTSVFSFIRVLMDMEEDEFKKETLETVFFNMNRISDILKQLSCFSKMPPHELGPCKVNTLIEDALSLIQYDARVQDMTIVKDLRPDVPPIVTDGNQLSQVVVNIVLNAADAMPKGGTLTIRSKIGNGGVVVEFEDTGAGISPEDLKRIFDPYYATKKKGKGLGLAVSYSIIKKLNGNLAAESESGKGSRFVITLPLS